LRVLSGPSRLFASRPDPRIEKISICDVGSGSMYARTAWIRLIGSVVAGCLGVQGGFVFAQAPATPTAQQQHQHASAAPEQPQQDHQDMQHMAREGSGTAWLPDATPMYAIHAMKGPWTLMFHDNAFLQYLNESGDRGDDQFGSINWFMGMAQRNAGPGRVMFRGMFSAEPGTIRG